MTEKNKQDERYIKRTKILYRSALICYLIPFLFLGIFLLDMFFIHRTEMLFWSMFLLSMFPFGLLGLLFSIIGIIQATNIKNLKKKTIGYQNLFMGIIVVAGGIVGWMLLYIVTSWPTEKTQPYIVNWQVEAIHPLIRIFFHSAILLIPFHAGKMHWHSIGFHFVKSTAMKPVIGYFFLALGATFAGVVLTVLYFALTGKLPLLDDQTQDPFYRTTLITYSIFQVLVMFSLFYYGIKWIKKDTEHEVSSSVNV